MATTEDREALLKAQEAKLQAQIEALQRKKRANTHRQQQLREDALRRERSQVGYLMQQMGLVPSADVPLKELHLALEQVARLRTHPLAWTQFLCGDLVTEWCGPEGTEHVLQLVREVE